MNRWTLILMLGVLGAGTLTACASAGDSLPANSEPITSGEATMSPKDTPIATGTFIPPSVEPTVLTLQVVAFADGGPIPARYTCNGENASPALTWSGVPVEANSLALIAYDADAGPDLGAGTDLGFVHWLVYDLTATTRGLPADATGDAQALAGALESQNDFHASAGAAFPGGALIRGTGYDGPCPPEEHTYVFRLMALDELLDLPAGTSPQSVLDALEGHVLAVSDWTGTYAPAQ